MELLTTITSIIIFSALSFLFGLIAMSKWIRSKKVDRPSIEKQPTRNSIYADHVIQVAAHIYSNYNESKIIRVGANPGPRIDRQSEALKDAFNLVNRAYGIFDNLDKDESQIVN